MKRGLFSFFLRNALRAGFWDEVQSTAKCFHLTAMLMLSEALSRGWAGSTWVSLVLSEQDPAGGGPWWSSFPRKAEHSLSGTHQPRYWPCFAESGCSWNSHRSISAGLLCQLHSSSESIGSGKCFKTAHFCSMGLLAVLLVWGQEQEGLLHGGKNTFSWAITILIYITYIHSTSTYGTYYYWGNVFLMRKTEQYLREKMFKPMLICSRSNKIF